MTRDIVINKECRIRVNADGTYGRAFHIRLSEPFGGHGEASHLTVAEAILLASRLLEFIKERT